MVHMFGAVSWPSVTVMKLFECQIPQRLMRVRPGLRGATQRICFYVQHLLSSRCYTKTLDIKVADQQLRVRNLPSGIFLQFIFFSKKVIDH